MLIKCKSLFKDYQLDGIKIKVLKDINLEIKKGEFISIMGPSGSGKSTLMHLLGLLDKPTKGEVYFQDKKTSLLSEKDKAKLRNEEIGFVFQSFNLLPRFSALENVKLSLLYSEKKQNLNKQEMARKMLKKVGLYKREEHHSNQLSGGEQQRVAIARSLINNPSLILADEPTGNLDSASGKEIMNIFKKLNKEGNTIIIVTHETDIAMRAKRIIRMKDGKIIYDK